MTAGPVSLGLLRRGIDGVDDALLLLLAGPGRVSLDRPTPWYRNAAAFCSAAVASA